MLFLDSGPSDPAFSVTALVLIMTSLSLRQKPVAWSKTPIPWSRDTYMFRIFNFAAESGTQSCQELMQHPQIGNPQSVVLLILNGYFLGTMASIFHAVVNNDIFSLHEYLLDSLAENIDQAVIGGLSALHVAAQKGYSSCVKVLLAAGANVDIQDEHGITPLMTAINAGYSLTAIKLIQASCDLDVIDQNGLCALHYAAQEGSAGIVQLLLMSGARPNICDKLGHSPLNLALQKSHTEVVKVMLFGCCFVEPSLAFACDYPSPLFKSLCECKFSISLTLLLGGYSGVLEMHRFWRQFKVGRKPRNLSVSEEESFNLLTSSELQIPSSLQHLCRLHIRKHLNRDIQRKVLHLRYPVMLKEYICFKDVYHGLKLDSSADMYAYFSDISREMSDFT